MDYRICAINKMCIITKLNLSYINNKYELFMDLLLITTINTFLYCHIYIYINLNNILLCLFFTRKIV